MSTSVYSGISSVIDFCCYSLANFAADESSDDSSDNSTCENSYRAAKCPDGCAELRVVGRVCRVHGSFSSGSSAGAPSLSGHCDCGSGSPFSSSRLWRFKYW